MIVVVVVVVVLVVVVMTMKMIVIMSNPKVDDLEKKIFKNIMSLYFE